MKNAPRPANEKITATSAREALIFADGELQAPYLLLDLRAEDSDPRIEPWLRAPHWPVLALIRPGANSPLVQACDVVAVEEEELASVIANIERSPIAASVLIQTLRATEDIAPEQALVVESLAYATLQAGPEFALWQKGRVKSVSRASENGPPVILERANDALSVTLNRPRNRNAMSMEMRDALVEAFTLAALDDTIGTLTVRGSGACFSVGGDLAEFGLAPGPAQAHMIRMQRLPAKALLPSAGRTVFHLHGACIGAGVELPAFAARITASADAFFQLPEIRFGLIPGAGGCVSIARRIGRQRMAYLALSARRISAHTALSWGLIDEITH